MTLLAVELSDWTEMSSAGVSGWVLLPRRPGDAARVRVAVASRRLVEAAVLRPRLDWLTLRPTEPLRPALVRREVPGVAGRLAVRLRDLELCVLPARVRLVDAPWVSARRLRLADERRGVLDCFIALLPAALCLRRESEARRLLVLARGLTVTAGFGVALLERQHDL